MTLRLNHISGKDEERIENRLHYMVSKTSVTQFMSHKTIQKLQKFLEPSRSIINLEWFFHRYIMEYHSTVQAKAKYQNVRISSPFSTTKAKCVSCYNKTGYITQIKRRYRLKYYGNPPVRSTILQWVESF